MHFCPVTSTLYFRLNRKFFQVGLDCSSEIGACAKLILPVSSFDKKLAYRFVFIHEQQREREREIEREDE